MDPDPYEAFAYDAYDEISDDPFIYIPKLDNINFLPCVSIDDADKLRDQLLELPSDFFVVPKGTYILEGMTFLGIDESCEIYLSPPTQTLKKKAICRVLEMGLTLDELGIVHNRLLVNNMVKVNYVFKADKEFKFNSVSEKFPNFTSEAAAIISQQLQLANITDYIVGPGETQNPLYGDFRQYLLASKTLVDLQSLFHHPYLAEENGLTYYFGCSQLIRSCGYLHRNRLNDMFGNFTWIENVNENGHEVIKRMLTSRIVDGQTLLYNDTPFDLYLFIWNTMRHANSSQINFWSMEAIHQEFLLLFPNYVLQMFQYMHTFGLNAHFGPETYSLPIFKYAMERDEIEDGSLFVPKVLKVCKFIYFLLAKFYTFCQNPDIAGKVQAIAERLNESILTLQNYKGIYEVCDYSRLPPDEITEIDHAVFFSVRCIYCALVFVELVIDGNQISHCVVKAEESTRRKFRRFYPNSLISSNEKRQFYAAAWPRNEDVMKIIGGSFIIREADYYHYKQNLEELRDRWFQMLANTATNTIS